MAVTVRKFLLLKHFYTHFNPKATNKSWKYPTVIINALSQATFDGRIRVTELWPG